MVLRRFRLDIKENLRKTGTVVLAQAAHGRLSLKVFEEHKDVRCVVSGGGLGKDFIILTAQVPMQPGPGRQMLSVGPYSGFRELLEGSEQGWWSHCWHAEILPSPFLAFKKEQRSTVMLIN